MSDIDVLRKDRDDARARLERALVAADKDRETIEFLSTELELSQSVRLAWEIKAETYRKEIVELKNRIADADRNTAYITDCCDQYGSYKP